MSRTMRLTDAGIRAALAPSPVLGAPAGLLAAISTEVARTPQHQRLVRLPALPATPITAWLRHDPRLAWVALAAALLLLALAGALIAGAMLRGLPVRQFAPEIPLVSTGVEILVPESRVFDRVLVDGRGTYWAAGPGRLTRFDPRTGERRTWTVADDAAFSGSAVAPARDGGVWISGQTRLLRFTGDGFVDPFGVQPMAVLAFTEQPDRTLWAVDWEDGPMRWDGGAWQPLPAGRPTTRAGILTITSGGDVWVSNLNARDADPLGAGVSRLSDGRWTTWGASDARPLGREIGAIVEAADGSIWVTMDPTTSSSDPGIARYSGGTWSVIDGPGFPAWWLEAAPDGSIWAVTAEVGAARVARHLDGSWTTYGAADGIEATGLGQVSATPAGVFLSTDQGLLRFADDRWIAAWPAADAGPEGGPLVAVSAGEAWTADARGVWHYVGGGWEGPTQPDGFADAWIGGLAVGPEGSVWIAGKAGVAVLRDGAWTVDLGQPRNSIAVTPDGTAWAGGQSTQIVGLRVSGSGFTKQKVTCPVGATSIAAAADGTIWLGSFAYAGWPGLAHFDGRSCTMVDVPGDGRPWDLAAIAAAPDGGIAVGLLETTGDGPWASRVARLDETGWTVIDRRDDVLVPIGDALAFDPSGELWRASREAGGLQRFDGVRWVPAASEIAIDGRMTFAPDGSLWSVGPSGVQRISASRLAAD